MKTLTGFFLVMFCLAFGLNTMAQFGDVIVFAPKGEKFSVFIGGKPQNQEPAARYDFTFDRDNYADVKEALHSEKSKDELDRYISGKTN